MLRSYGQSSRSNYCSSSLSFSAPFLTKSCVKNILMQWKPLERTWALFMSNLHCYRSRSKYWSSVKYQFNPGRILTSPVTVVYDADCFCSLSNNLCLKYIKLGIMVVSRKVVWSSVKIFPAEDHFVCSKLSVVYSVINRRCN